MKKTQCIFCYTTCTANKKQLVFSALTGTEKKYITYTVSIPLKPLAEKSRKTGIGGIAGTGYIPRPTPAESRAIHGLRRGGTAGAAKINFFLFFLFGGFLRRNRFHVGR
jgi:hypothetical protein